MMISAEIELDKSTLEIGMIISSWPNETAAVVFEINFCKPKTDFSYGLFIGLLDMKK